MLFSRQEYWSGLPFSISGDLHDPGIQCSFLLSPASAGVTGRKKNIIVLSNGKNIYPEEIEGRLLRVEEIEEAVVRGLRDERGDESALAAEVYLNTPVEESELRKKIGRELEDLPSYKRIKEITVRDEIRKN